MLRAIFFCSLNRRANSSPYRHNWASPTNFATVWAETRIKRKLVAQTWLSSLLRAPDPAVRHLAIKADIDTPLMPGYQKVYCEGDELIYTSGCRDASCFFCSGRRYRASEHTFLRDTFSSCDSIRESSLPSLELAYSCFDSKIVPFDCMDNDRVVEPLYIEGVVSISQYHHCYQQVGRDDVYNEDIAWDAAEAESVPVLPNLDGSCEGDYVASACLEAGSADDDCCALEGKGTCATGYVASIDAVCDPSGPSLVTCCYRDMGDRVEHARDDVVVYEGMGWFVTFVIVADLLPLLNRCDSLNSRELPRLPNAMACWVGCLDLYGSDLVAVDFTNGGCFCRTSCYCLNEVGIPGILMVVRSNMSIPSPEDAECLQSSFDL